MKRRHFIISSGLISSSTLAVGLPETASAYAVQSDFAYAPPVMIDKGLPVPSAGKIRVAFAINPGTQVIDLAGPWETFQDTYIRAGESPLAKDIDSEHKRGIRPFDLYTVSETTNPIKASGGLIIVPTYSIDQAPEPHVLVIPHFDTEGVTPIHEWIKHAAAKTTLTMSVCTGAYQLAKTGLLDGRAATTNVVMYNDFAKTFPRVNLIRGPRFVEADGISTAGGLTAGIDLALRVVERFFSTDIAQRTATFMEYVGSGWKK